MARAGSVVTAASITIGGATFDVWATPAGITRLTVPECRLVSCPPLRERFEIEAHGEAPGAESVWIERLGLFLEVLLSGTEPGQAPAVDLSTLSGFTVEVLDIVYGIPWGARRSYRWVATRTPRPSSARAVGGALGRNPVPMVIPCHRVIREDGSPGGYSGGDGWKERLLGLEDGAQGSEGVLRGLPRWDNEKQDDSGCLLV